MIKARTTYAHGITVAVAAASLIVGFTARAQDVKLTDLRATTQKLRDDERRASQERITRFRAEQQKIERQAQEAVQRKTTAEARSNSLDKAWNENEKRIAEINNLLKQRQGNLGELFGVTRQVAGDSANVLQASILSTQYGTPKEGEERSEFLRRLAGAKALPSLPELDRLWFELMREMTDAGKVVKYRASVLQPDNTRVDEDVIRVGPFTASSDGKYLGYLPSTKSLAALNGELEGDFPQIGRSLQAAVGGTGYTKVVVDPARGALLGMYVERPGLIRRIQQGEAVAYVIVAVGILGVAVAFFQAIYLIVTRFAVVAQLKNLNNPSKGNPLGRVLLSFRGDSNRTESAELAELRISEAVLREVPKLERFQAFLRLAVAAGPLLGLIGTVIGMIITFRAIVASGTSDPKLMATGIGQAMINTVLGLSIAIPLLFINAGLATLSRFVTQTLDEQSQSLLAETVKQKQA
ncbi:MAG: MotA/TolQ/ExbB proton channel family protein [Gammaproteobacteria bacterium]